MPTTLSIGRRTLVATACALFCAQVHAQSTLATATAPVKAAAATDPAPMATVQVNSSADKYDARRDDTATKIVVTSEEILKHGDTALADVLKRQPGVTVSGGNAGRGGGEIRMRGLGNGYTQVLLNGEPAPPGFSLDSLSPDMVERIEIVRAATAEFSTQAIAGTINIVLKKAVKVAQRELKTSLSGAGNFISPAFNLQVSDKIGKMSYSVAVNGNVGRFHQYGYQTDEAFDPAGVQTLLRRAVRYNEGPFANLSVSPRVNWTLPSGDTLTSQTFLSVNGVRPKSETQWTADIGPLPQYASDRTTLRNLVSTARTDLNWVHKVEGGGKLDTKFGLNAYNRNNDFHQLASNGLEQLTLDEITPSSAHERGFTWTGKYSAPFAENHTLAIGWDGAAARRHEERAQLGEPIPGYVPNQLHQIFDANSARLALFAQDEWNVTPEWSVYFGLRWEGLRTTSEGNDFDGMRNQSSVLSPLFQTLWKLPNSKNDQVRFALTRTYKAPDLDRLIPRRNTTTNNGPTTPDIMGNPNLKPELALGIDASYEHYFGEGAMLSASAYARRIDDYTRRDVQQIGSRWVQLPVNDGSAEAHGFELEAKFPLQLFYKEAPALDLRANLARNWSHVDGVPGPDNRLADQVPLSANFGVDWKASAAWTVGGSFAFKTGGLQRVSEVAYSYATVKRDLDLYALWKATPRVQLRFSVLNALAQPFTNIDLYDTGAARLRFTRESPVTPLYRIALEMKL